MAEKTLKLATLNLWRFYEWEERLPAIISLLKSTNPDVVLLQEVQRDISKDERNQAEILNQLLSYPYVHFERVCVKTTRKGKPFPNPLDHGVAILSKYSIKTSVIKLTQAPDDKEPRIILKADINIHGETISFAAVHFSNSDSWAEAHFKETMNILGKEKIKSIIVGDFNLKDLKQYRSMYENTHLASSDDFNYISYPHDNVSYDYILIPKKYKFLNFQCREEVVSDHRLLYSEIKL